MRSKLFDYSKSIYLFRSMAAIVVMLLAFVVGGVGQRGPGVKVDTGKEVEFRLPFAFNRQGLGVQVSPVGLVTVERNTDDEFVVTGQASGDGLITVTGTKDGIDAAGRNVILPFRYLVPVRVLARTDVDTKTRPISVGKGTAAAKTFDVGYIMQPGQEFYRLSERGITWQGADVVYGSNSVARGEVFVENNQYKLRITGLSDGKTTLRLLGERRVGSEWQRVERILQITVGTGRSARPANAGANDPASDEPAPDQTVPDPRNRDEVVSAIERYYDSLQNDVLQDNYGDAKAARLLKNLEDLVNLIDQELREEEALDQLELSRRARLERVKNKAKADIEQLKIRLNKNPKPADDDPLAGKWRLLENGQLLPGEVRFKGNGGPIVNIMKDSKTWLTTRSGNQPVRTVFMAAEAQDRFAFSGQILIDLRGDATSGRLEFWATTDLSGSEKKKTGYVLVREDKLR